MPAATYAFVSTRGGVGKSSLASQLAPAIALANPNKSVLLIDCSIQGDASVFLCGGTDEPTAFAPGVRTLGGERMAAISMQRTALGFINAAQNAYAAASVPAVVSRSFWRGSTVATNANTAIVFDWKEHSVPVSQVHPTGGAPANLFISTGGRTLHGMPFNGISVALKAVFNAMENDVIVLIDTDAELSERGASLGAIGAVSYLAMIISASWPDYLRALEDPANSLFAALAYLERNVPNFNTKIKLVIANGVQKTRNAFTSMCGVTNVVPFTPMSLSLDAVSEIVTHLHGFAVDPANNVSQYFYDSTRTLANPGAFISDVFTAVPTFAEGVWQRTWNTGKPIIVKPWNDEPAQAAGAIMETVSLKF